MASIAEQFPQNLGGEESATEPISEPDFSDPILVKRMSGPATEILTHARAAHQEPPPAPSTAAERIDAERDPKVKEDIRAALKPHIDDQLHRLWRAHRLQPDSILVIPKKDEYGQLINELRQNGYLASETEDAVELDFNGRLVAGLFANSNLSNLAQRYLREPYGQITHQVVSEEIDEFIENITMPE